MTMSWAAVLGLQDVRAHEMSLSADIVLYERRRQQAEAKRRRAGEVGA